MKFESDLYQKVYSEYELEKAKDESKKDLIRRVYDCGKSFAINYFPFVGCLPVRTQQDWKDKANKVFGTLNIKTATFASAIGLGLGAYFIGLNLDGFDIGFEMANKVTFGGMYSGEVGEIIKYVSFPFVWGGFSKAVTQVLSYYLITESAVRATLNLAGKPLGCLIGEAASYLMDKKSKSSKAMQEREEKLLRDAAQADSARSFIEKDRKEYEKTIANLTKNIWKAKTEEEKKTFQSQLEKLIKKQSEL